MLKSCIQYTTVRIIGNYYPITSGKYAKDQHLQSFKNICNSGIDLDKISGNTLQQDDEKIDVVAVINCGVFDNQCKDFNLPHASWIQDNRIGMVQHDFKHDSHNQAIPIDSIYSGLVASYFLTYWNLLK